MIIREQQRFYLFSASALVGSLLLVLAVNSWSPTGRGRRIAARNQEARGGVDHWRAVKTMRLSGKLDAGNKRDPEKLAQSFQSQARMKSQMVQAAAGAPATDGPAVQLPFTMELMRPRKTRLEIQFAGETAVQVYDGTQGWKVRPFLGRHEVEPYSPEELRLASLQDELDGPLVDAARKGNRVEVVGSETIAGKDTYKLAVTLPNGQVRHVWVDKQTALDVRIDGERRLDGKVHAVYTYFRDYQRVGELMVPHTLETVVDGVRGSEKISIEHVVVNPPLDDDRFRRPNPFEASRAQPASAGDKPANGDAADPHAQHRAAAEKLKRATRTTADYKLPTVTLTRDDGKSVAFPAEIDDGKPVVLNFVFTTCATICPVMSHIFSELQDTLGTDRDKIHLVSISIDPDEDRPARLAEYARKLHAGPEWRHYTGTTQASVAVQKAFDAYRGDKMSHTPVTFLRAAPGSPWVRIDGFATADELAAEVREMLAHR